MPHQRRTLEDMREEQSSFIGPPAPPQIPKFTPERYREAVRQMMLRDLAERIAAETAEYK